MEKSGLGKIANDIFSILFIFNNISITIKGFEASFRTLNLKGITRNYFIQILADSIIYKKCTFIKSERNYSAF